MSLYPGSRVLWFQRDKRKTIAKHPATVVRIVKGEVATRVTIRLDSGPLKIVIDDNIEVVRKQAL